MKSVLRTLSGLKVAVLMADGFEMAEYTIPVNALRAAGAKVTVVSLRRGRIRGVNLHEPAHKVGVHLTVDEANASDYDALFIPGGFVNPDLLRQSKAARDFVSAFDAANKPIATLCHGPWVLASAGLVSGRTLTSWPGVRDDMVNGGATWIDAPVVRNGNWITSRGPQDFASFVPALLEFYQESDADRALTEPSRTRSSPQRNEAPAVVLGAMKWLPRPSFRGFALGFLVGGLAAMRRERARNRRLSLAS